MRNRRTLTDSERERIIKEFEETHGFSVVAGKCFEVNEDIPDIYFKVKEVRDDLMVVGMQVDKENMWISYEVIALEQLAQEYTPITYPYFKRVLECTLMDLGEYDPLNQICQYIVELKTKEIPEDLILSLCMVVDDLAMILHKIKERE